MIILCVISFFSNFQLLQICNFNVRKFKILFVVPFFMGKIILYSVCPLFTIMHDQIFYSKEGIIAS